MYALRFLKEFIANPHHVGSITPSSKQLAAAVCEATKVREAGTVVEFGPGTGAITEVLLTELRPEAKFFAMEINSDFVKVLRNHFPNITVHEDSAEKTKSYLRQLGVEHCDSIVSGLPWAFFSEDLQNSLLDAAVESLRPGGLFATYIYVTSYLMPSSFKFRAKIRKHFAEMGMSKIVWPNVPPAIVVWGRK